MDKCELMKKIGFDMDGVLVDWAFGFARTARALGLPMPQYSFKEWHRYGAEKDYLSTREISQVWKIIRTEPLWWAHLPIMPDVTPNDAHRLKLLSKTSELFFVTHRMSDASPVSTQTALWVKWNIGIEFPNVIVAKNKGDVARAIGLDFMLEDKIENAWCVHWITQDSKHPTASYLIDRPYNQHDPKPNVGSPSIIRVNSVKEYLDAIDRSL